MRPRYPWLVAAALLLTAPLAAQAPSTTPARTPAPPAPDFPRSDPAFKTRIEVNRWHGYDELVADMQRLQRAFPKFLTLSSIGKSVEGRDIEVMTILNPDTGAEATKAGMYIEANVHGNEIQGAEVCLYTIWYLMEHYDRLPRIKELVDERVFYIVPTVNPDGREHFLQVRSGGRSGAQPVDNDNDGVADEDDVDDLNGNGVIEQMRRYVPGQGTHRVSALDPRILEPAPPGTKGDYVLLGFEGIDNDGDGLINEDGPGGYDPNRNWAADWQPNYVQNGSMDYPFQLPEARAVSRFLLSKPNVAGVQSYHNAGGMILRGPGAESQGEYPTPDVRVYDEIGRNGERMLPYYRYLVIWSGLYTVHGGFIDWTNDDLGIVSFSNELWNSGQYFSSPAQKDEQRRPESPITPRASGLFFDDKLELGGEFVDWAPFDHPTLGRIEIGGWRHTFGRLPPRFMNEELCHRNMAFTLYQAGEMPHVRIDAPSVDSLGEGLWRVRVPIVNDRLTPTILTLAERHRAVRPDLVTLSGATVVAAGWVRDRFRPGASDLIDQKDLSRILVRNGQPGRATRVLEYLVRGSGSVTVTYDSAKGGRPTVTIPLKATTTAPGAATPAR
jgi:hypothetical protein